MELEKSVRHQEVIARYCEKLSVIQREIRSR